MNKQWLSVISRAINSDLELFQLNQTWQAIHREYNIGLLQVKKLRLSSADKQELQGLVKEMTGIDLKRTHLIDFVEMDREQVLSLAIDEKLAGLAVKKNRLAIKPLPGKQLKLNGQNYRLPECGHWDVSLENIATIGHSSLWIVENYRCFDRLDIIKLGISAASTEPLVVFRGDNVYHERTVINLIEKLQLPVWVMGDLDPKGLVIAQSYPNFAGLIAPEITVLESFFQDHEKANRQLYEKQLAGCQNTLSKARYPIITACWELMKTHQAGVVQEYWLLDRVALISHSSQSAE